MNCPLCIDQTLEPNYRSGIEIDVCPNCKGVWLDRGEIDKLAVEAEPRPKSKKADRPRPAPEWERESGRDDDRPAGKTKNKKKRKKSLAERLGDVLEEVLD